MHLCKFRGAPKAGAPFPHSIQNIDHPRGVGGGNLMKLLHCRLGELMAERGPSLTDLSRQSGVCRESIRGLLGTQWHHVSQDTIRKLCDELEIDVGDLFALIEKDLWHSVRVAKEVTIHVG